MTLIRSLAAGALLAISVSALADFKTLARASEVKLSEFRLPASANGIATFKSCRSCDTEVVNVSEKTTYRLNDRNVSLPELRQALATVSNRDRTTVLIMHQLDSDLITQISIRL
ncbi:MAG: hypothetical protein KJN77_02655 [Gammaproteobacteria bacterium]|nr:hypothetical protein [Gammaproteobacteria bacterium]